MDNQQPSKPDKINKPDFFSTWEYRLIRIFLLVSTLITLLKWLVSEIMSFFVCLWEEGLTLDFHQSSPASQRHTLLPAGSSRGRRLFPINFEWWRLDFPAPSFPTVVRRFNFLPH